MVLDCDLVRRFAGSDTKYKLKIPYADADLDAAVEGVTFINTGNEPLVTLRYFGPDANPGAPNVGDHKK